MVAKLTLCSITIGIKFWNLAVIIIVIIIIIIITIKKHILECHTVRVRQKGRPSHTWLRGVCAIEVDLKPLNIGLLSAWKNTTGRRAFCVAGPSAWNSLHDNLELELLSFV